MKPLTVTQLKKIVEAGGTVGIRSIISSLKTVISETDDDYDSEESITKWEKLQELSIIACSDLSRGDDDDYHNLAVEFARLDYHDCAIAVLEKGLKGYKYSADLLADMILYGIESGQINKSDTAYNRLIKLDKSAWGWRAYSFITRYYLEKAKSYPSGKIREKLKQQALQIADEFVNYSTLRSPKDIDRAYSNKASVYKVFGGDDAERSLLKKGFSSVESAPQCALGIADNLFECGQYNKALPYIEKCMIAVNKPQPDINPAYVHLIYALSKTQQLMDKEPLSDYSERRGEIEEIYKHFHIATDAFGSQENFLDVAKQTIKAITIQTGIEDTTNTSDFYI